MQYNSAGYKTVSFPLHSFIHEDSFLKVGGSNFEGHTIQKAWRHFNKPGKIPQDFAKKWLVRENKQIKIFV
jgi:hypothetical protein